MFTEDLFSVEGKTCLVTGATSGIGLMIAEGLLRAGAKVYTFARGAEGVDETRKALGPLGALTAFVGDVGSSEGVEAIAQKIAETEPSLHILINNVGATARAPIDEYSRAEFERVASINLAAPFDLTRAMLPLLGASATEEDPARVIHISSVGALHLMKNINNFAYSSSKAGLLMLTRHMAADLAARNITVNTIAPGIFYSKLSAYLFDPTHPQYNARPKVPLDRAGAMEDIAGAVIYLCSRAGAYVTGSMIPVSGGFGVASWGE